MALLHAYAMGEESLTTVENYVRDWNATRGVASRLLKVAIELHEIHRETDCF